MYYISTTIETTPIFDKQLFHVKLGSIATHFIVILYSPDFLKLYKNPEAQNNIENSLGEAESLLIW